MSNLEIPFYNILKPSNDEVVMVTFTEHKTEYIDGKLVRTCLLPGTAQVNSDSNLYVTPKGGFDGWTAKLQYYPNSLNPQEVWNIYTQGYSSGLSMFGTYQVQIALMENGNEQGSITF